MRFSQTLSILSIAALSACGGAGGGSAPQLPATSNASQMPGAAGAAASFSGTTWSAQAGGAHQRGALQALAMLPGTITIDEGDSITWTAQGEVHTITFLGSNVKPPGDPTVPQGGSTFDGTNFVSSGIIAPGQTYTLKFTKAGTYGYQCFLHPPEMTGTVVVQPAGTPYPHPQGFYTGMGTSDLNAILSDAMTAVKQIPFAVGGTTVAAGTAPGGPSAAPDRATVLRFLNGDRLNLTSVTIPLGGIVTWINESNNEPHTITFPAAGQPLPPLPGDPFTPPMGTIVNGQPIYNGTEVTNSGPIGSTAIGLPPGTPNQYSLKFTVRGTFTYVCLFHDAFGMVGTVVVQ